MRCKMLVLKTMMMRKAFLILLVTVSMQEYLCGQTIARVPDSIRKKYQATDTRPAKGRPIDLTKLDQDSLIREKLVELAYKNTGVVEADAGIRIAEANLDLAKKSWFSSVTAGANINEFVVNSSPQANFFPKYNLGIAIPFDIIARSKREKKVAQENLLISQENRKEKQQLVKAEVLIRYETYKERKEQVLIQKNSIEYDYSGYLAAQKGYADGDVKLEDMDKAYQNYLGEKQKLVSRELELRIATIQLEQIIGISLEEATRQALKQ